MSNSNAHLSVYEKVGFFFKNRLLIAILAFSLGAISTSIGIVEDIAGFCEKRGIVWCTLIDCVKAKSDAGYRGRLTLEEQQKCGL